MHHRILSALALSCVPGGPWAAAQDGGLSGAGGTYSTARVVASGGGVSTSPSFYTLESTVGPRNVVGASQHQLSFQRAGVVAAPNTLPAGRAWLFGIAQARGTKDGGDLVHVYGTGFQSMGAVIDLRFDGVSAGALNVLSDHELTVTSPAGVDPFLNPKGRVVVEARFVGGETQRLADAFVYTPAIVQHAPALVGQTTALELWSPAGSFQQVFYGISAPGLGVAVPPFDGAARLLLLNGPLSPFVPATSNATTLLLPVPASQALVGLSLEFQGIAIDLFPLGGSFTNVHTMTLGG